MQYSSALTSAPGGGACAMGSTQPLKMSTSKTPGGKDGRCVRVTTLPLSQCRKSRRSRSLNLLEPREPHQACSGTLLPLPYQMEVRGHHHAQVVFFGIKVLIGDLRRGSVADCLLGLRVRTPPGALIPVSCECCVCAQVQVSKTGRSLVQRSPTDCGVYQ
jgi:hypothetical protein